MARCGVYVLESPGWCAAGSIRVRVSQANPHGGNQKCKQTVSTTIYPMLSPSFGNCTRLYRPGVHASQAPYPEPSWSPYNTSGCSYRTARLFSLDLQSHHISPSILPTLLPFTDIPEQQKVHLCRHIPPTDVHSCVYNDIAIWWIWISQYRCISAPFNLYHPFYRTGPNTWFSDCRV